MAVYKVPQDVEADDKLIGPFSFRQFIYLGIVAMSGALAWGLWNLFPPLAIIPLPLILFFSAIALPLRKDQPMEIYMAAMLSFFLKPHMRKWDPDGLESLIEITALKTIDYQMTKDISQDEAQRRFDYLADVVDSRGWAVRGVSTEAQNSAMKSEVYLDAQNTDDILDEDNHMAKLLNEKLGQSDADRRKEIAEMMQSKQTEKSNSFNYFTNSNPELTQTNSTNLLNTQNNNNEKSIEVPVNNQTPVKNLAIPDLKPEPTTSEKIPSADIIDLANNTELSVATIAAQANRINDKQSQEVFISLR